MPITFACQHCDRSYTVADAMAGKKAKCKACGNAMDVPIDDPVSAHVVPAASSSRASRIKARRGMSSGKSSIVRTPRRKSDRTSQRRAEKSLGLGEIQSTDIFSGSNSARPPALDNHAIDAGFAEVSPEEIAFRRQAELEALRNKKPKLEDYLTDDDRMATSLGVAATRHDQEDAGWQAFLPGLVFTGVLFLLALIGLIGSFFGTGVPMVMFILLLIFAGLCSASSEIWGMMICLKYDSDKFIWYFLFPIYRVIYLFQNLSIMKGPMGMYGASIAGFIFAVILLAIAGAITGDFNGVLGIFGEGD